MPGKGCGFARNSLHHVAIAANCVHLEIKHLKIRPVEMLRQPVAGNRHSDAIADTLTQRPGSGFDAGSPAILRVPGASAVELTKALDVFELDGKFAEAF